MATIYDYLMGIGITFGLGLGFSYLLERDELSLKSFFIYSTMFDAFAVWVNLMPLWSLIALFIVDLIIIIIHVREMRGGRVV